MEMGWLKSLMDLNYNAGDGVEGCSFYSSSLSLQYLTFSFRSPSSTSFIPSKPNQFLSHPLNDINRIGSQQILTKQETVNEQQQAKSVKHSFNFKTYMVQKAESVNRAMDAAVSLKDPIMIHEAIRYSLLARGKKVQLVHCLFVCEIVVRSESIYGHTGNLRC
ncbi:hypothetical protein M0R45_030579 [Rubus argutus]|uniref:Uncharacterized protein n=1 Tax=Rubus argutus TaxID=59490 RepID=A0AAW1WDG1_RUBAR